jgi:hypothetical protein
MGRYFYAYIKMETVFLFIYLYKDLFFNFEGMWKLNNIRYIRIIFYLIFVSYLFYYRYSEFNLTFFVSLGAFFKKLYKEIGMTNRWGKKVKGKKKSKGNKDSRKWDDEFSWDDQRIRVYFVKRGNCGGD